jgi:hypothetical protein
LRRLSSTTARPVDLYAGNVAVAPERHLSRPSDAYEAALALERAKSHLEEESGESTPDASTGVMTLKRATRKPQMPTLSLLILTACSKEKSYRKPRKR